MVRIISFILIAMTLGNCSLSLLRWNLCNSGFSNPGFKRSSCLSFLSAGARGVCLFLILFLLTHSQKLCLVAGDHSYFGDEGVIAQVLGQSGLQYDFKASLASSVKLCLKVIRQPNKKVKNNQVLKDIGVMCCGSVV